MKNQGYFWKLMPTFKRIISVCQSEAKPLGSRPSPRQTKYKLSNNAIHYKENAKQLNSYDLGFDEGEMPSDFYLGRGWLPTTVKSKPKVLPRSKSIT
jgi:hypothetical protein